MNQESDYYRIYEDVEDANVGDYLILSNGFVYRKKTIMTGMWQSVNFGGTKTAGTMTQILSGATNAGIIWSFS